MEIPKLIEAKNPPEILKKLIESEEDFIDMLPREKYRIKILDVFNHTLSKDDEN